MATEKQLPEIAPVCSPQFGDTDELNNEIKRLRKRQHTTSPNEEKHERERKKKQLKIDAFLLNPSTGDKQAVSTQNCSKERTVALSADIVCRETAICLPASPEEEKKHRIRL